MAARPMEQVHATPIMAQQPTTVPAPGAMPGTAMPPIVGASGGAGVEGVGAILSAMREFPEDTRLQRWCCESLYNLIRGNNENLKACTSHGGVETVLRALKLDKSDTILVARADDLINALWEF